FIRTLERKEPYLDNERRSQKKQFEFLMQNGNMRGHYLGACLDSCRWGGQTTVMWETNIKELMDFIQNWREQNNDDPNLYHELPIERLYKRFELPHIDHEKCPDYLLNCGKIIYWKIKDPYESGIEETRKIRDIIKKKVLSLI
ncbi:MAG: hypothetical protein AABY22_11215, partial [Nanoarchaeota archaeon]